LALAGTVGIVGGVRDPKELGILLGARVGWHMEVRVVVSFDICPKGGNKAMRGSEVRDS
jgi:hypothetical protein